MNMQFLSRSLAGMNLLKVLSLFDNYGMKYIIIYCILPK